jgi:hypothetical protein
MTPEQFFYKVEAMRQAQKSYFATRDPDILRKSRALEAEIDKEIKRTRQIKAEQQRQAAPCLDFGDKY